MGPGGPPSDEPPQLTLLGTDTPDTFKAHVHSMCRWIERLERFHWPACRVIINRNNTIHRVQPGHSDAAVIITARRRHFYDFVSHTQRHSDTASPHPLRLREKKTYLSVTSYGESYPTHAGSPNNNQSMNTPSVAAGQEAETVPGSTLSLTNIFRSGPSILFIEKHQLFSL